MKSQFRTRDALHKSVAFLDLVALRRPDVLIKLKDGYLLEGGETELSCFVDRAILHPERAEKAVAVQMTRPQSWTVNLDDKGRASFVVLQ